MKMESRKMKILSVILLAVVAAFSGCSKGDNGVSSTTSTSSGEDWTYPSSSSKFAVTAYTAKDTVAIADSFDVKVVCYNLSSVFGASVQMSYDPSKVRVRSLVAGSYVGPDSVVIKLSDIDSTSGLVSFGISYLNGSGRSSSGSGVLFKAKCMALAAGMVTFTVDTTKLEILKSDGTSIAGFDTLSVENESITIK